VVLAPIGLLTWLCVRTGRWKTVDASERSERPTLYMTVLGALLVLAAYYEYSGNPAVTLIVFIILMFGVALALNRWIKFSLHLAFVGFYGLVLVRIQLGYGLPLLLLIPFVAWSRLVLLRHNVREVLSGLILGLSAAILFLTVGCASIEKRFLFHPSHRPTHSELAPWEENGALIGYSRIVESPKNIWLMLHGNAGQASDRMYPIPCFSAQDSVFIMEYPGFGGRDGSPSRDSFNRAAMDAYLFLRRSFPHHPICVVGESIGSGPAAFLASLAQPPDKFVFIVPFDRLRLVARDYAPAFLVKLILKTDWDNVEALSHYRGPVDVFGAKDDRVIPVRHAKALATTIPTSKFVLIPGGHNDWSFSNRVQIRNP